MYKKYILYEQYSRYYTINTMLKQYVHKQLNKQLNSAILKNAKYYKNNEYWSFL